MFWKVRGILQQLRKRQIFGPDKLDSIVELPELFRELFIPEFPNWARTRHHQYLMGLRKQLKGVFDCLRKIVDYYARCLVFGERGIAHKALIDGGKQHWRIR